jgi:DNA-binding CsgD family transcriptional regulator/tetratricopeptide (TPR) repeat protein
MHRISPTDLLERDAQLRELHELRSQGEGRVALVCGEAGIGKTALVDAFTREVGARAPDVRVLSGLCDALFTPRPLGPLLDVARQAGGRLAASVGGDREHLFGAFLDLLSASPPAVVVFEDVHWADEATLDLLRYAGRRMQGARALLVITFRDDELEPSHPLRAILADMPRDLVRRIPLPRLSPAAVSALARRAHRSERGLYDATSGNPFFVTEVLAGEVEAVPASVRDTILARGARLDPLARRVLDLVSLVPGRTEAGLIEEVLGGSDGVVACRDAGMLEATDSGVSFRHELARRAWEEVLDSARARDLHARVLAALLARADGVEAARIVHHAAGAGDEGRVLRHAPEAAREAARLGAHVQAAELYAAAEPHAGPLPIRERAELLEAWAWELHLIGRIEDATNAQRRALSLWRAADEPLRVGESLRRLARLAWFRGELDDVRRLGEEAIAVLETLGATPELAMAYSSRSQTHMLLEECASAIAWGERAIAMARKLDRTEILVHALNNVGTAREIAGDSHGRALLEESLGLALEQGRHEDAGRAWINLAETASWHRDFERSDAYAEPGLRFCLDHDLDSYALCLLGDRSWNRLVRGRWSDAIADAEHVLAHPRVPPVDRIPALATLGRIRARRGDPDVDGPLDEAWSLALPTEEMCRLWPAIVGRLEASWLRGREDGVERGRSVLERALHIGNRWAAGEIAYWLHRLGVLGEAPSSIAEPYALALRGELHAAGAAFARIGATYERALVLSDGDEADAREGFETLADLGARAALEVLARDLRARGVRGLPRGPTRATRRNPARLTARQVQVLALLGEGLTNADIGERLFISPKTAAHHVSAVLEKLDVRTRGQAAARARELGIL